MGAKNCDHATRLRARNWFFSSLLVRVSVIHGSEIHGFGASGPNLSSRSRSAQPHVGGGQVVAFLESLPELSGRLVAGSDFRARQDTVEIFLAAADSGPEMLRKTVECLKQGIGKEAAFVAVAAKLPDREAAAMRLQTSQHEA